ncbi:tryptophan synthase subunit alpha [Miniphocaeibacter massiliensis]|uniref:tryptophan synthase subunit alpha n=1 Tax=Miniphocaeibacter massiliensis TaxID=2041841 RepID=UPI000C1C0649|nr:tryptophan synthase subunit alpha [Miniphocaeibacter massiliensis]
MNRIEKAFENKKAFIGFITAGDPDIETTEKIIEKMVEAGTDLIEIGIPFSDPNAEGVVIQDANLRALEKETDIDDIFKMVESLRNKIDIPITLMSYMNPIFYYGYEEFFSNCNKVGIDGVIIADLPYEEIEEIKEYLDKYDVALVPMIAPTSNGRIEKLVKDSKGFVYVVSSLGVTGVRTEINKQVEDMVKEVKKYTNTPVAVGFGISTNAHVKEISNISDGVIVGSAIVEVIEKYGEDAPEKVYDFIKELKK